MPIPFRSFPSSFPGGRHLSSTPAVAALAGAGAWLTGRRSCEVDNGRTSQLSSSPAAGAGTGSFMRQNKPVFCEQQPTSTAGASATAGPVNPTLLAEAGGGGGGSHLLQQNNNPAATDVAAKKERDEFLKNAGVASTPYPPPLQAERTDAAGRPGVAGKIIGAITDDPNADPFSSDNHLQPQPVDRKSSNTASSATSKFVHDTSNSTSSAALGINAKTFEEEYQFEFSKSRSSLLRLPEPRDAFVCRAATLHDDSDSAGAGAGCSPPANEQIITKRDLSNNETIAIIGSGAAGLSAVETLRTEAKFTGRIVLISKEPGSDYPIFRALLSKDAELFETASKQRFQSFFDKYEVDFFHETEVTKIDGEKNLVYFQSTSKFGKKNKILADEKNILNKQDLKFDKLLISTGSSPKAVFVPGAQNMANVFTYRTKKDFDNLMKQINLVSSTGSGIASTSKTAKNSNSNLTRNGKKCIIVGGGVTGMELANLLTGGEDIACQVTMLDKAPLPFEKRFGKRVGAGLAKHLAMNKVLYFGNTTVKQFKGGIGMVNAVELDTGDVLPCDFVIMCVGNLVGNTVPMITPGGSVAKARDGSLLCDPFLNCSGFSIVGEAEDSSSSAGDIFAAGDVATYPDVRTSKYQRATQWNTAVDQGRVAALNMVGDLAKLRKEKEEKMKKKKKASSGASSDSSGGTSPPAPAPRSSETPQGRLPMMNKIPYINDIPYFTTRIFNKKIEFIGHVDTLEHSVVEGDIDSMKFSVFYVNQRDEITGLLTVGREEKEETRFLSLAVQQLMEQRKMPKASEVIIGLVNAEALVRKWKKEFGISSEQLQLLSSSTASSSGGKMKQRTKATGARSASGAGGSSGSAASGTEEEQSEAGNKMDVVREAFTVRGF
ncbi:unnamed protein product [Amoebophrya sp. A120]|nr:unnamed protein product [Amoebophrya sp. A120]|eukprot:GSA120T00009708001.1